MKKQLFIFVLLAFFAGIFNASAQDCTPGALNPAAGVPYDYSVVISGAGYSGTTGSYTWYVTTNTDLLSATGVVDNDGSMFATVTGYNTPTVALNPLTLTWTTAAITSGSTFYLVVKFSQANSTATPSCTAMNMKVWQIKPINKFLLAINSFTGAVGQSGVYCFADITGATVTAGTPGSVQYTYGNNTIYAEVTPSFFTGQWTPSFQISTLTGDQAVTSVTWDTSPTGTFANTTTLTSPSSGIYNAVATSNAPSVYDGSTKVYVKIVIANNNYEGLSDETIKIAVDGIIPGTPPLNDVKSDTDCSDEDIFGKFVNQTIKARPTVTSGTGNFIPKNP
jgi:hypothetical protein